MVVVGELVVAEGMVDFQVIGLRTVVVEVVVTGVGKDGEVYVRYGGSITA